MAPIRSARHNSRFSAAGGDHDPRGDGDGAACCPAVQDAASLVLTGNLGDLLGTRCHRDDIGQGHEISAAVVEIAPVGSDKRCRAPGESSVSSGRSGRGGVVECWSGGR
jgi:hypothetical protein